MMLRRLTPLVLAVLAGATAIEFLVNPAAPASMRAATAGLIALAAVRTELALLAVVAFGPLASPIEVLWGSGVSWTEPLLLALLFGWLLRRVVRSCEGDRAADRLALALTCVVLSSAAVLTAAQRPLADPSAAGSYLNSAVWLMNQWLTRPLSALPGGRAALEFAAGVGLFALVADVCRRRAWVAPALARVLLVTVAAVGVFNVNRGAEVLLRRADFWEAAASVLPKLRVSALFPDVNAAGALYLLAIPVAVDAVYRRSDRVLGIVTLGPLLAGLFLSGSRVALALTPAALLLLATLHARCSGHWRAAALAILLIAGGGTLAVVMHPRAATYASAVRAVEIRTDMAVAALAMTRESPLFGVGIGQFHRRSPEFMPDRVKKAYAAENAHNQFLQVLAELGTIGLTVFLMTLASGLVPAAATSIRRPGEAQWLPGLFLGALIFLLAAVSMHPLLIPEVSLVFWGVLGACRALASSARKNKEELNGAWAGPTTSLFVAAMVALVPARALALMETVRAAQTRSRMASLSAPLPCAGARETATGSGVGVSAHLTV